MKSKVSITGSEELLILTVGLVQNRLLLELLHFNGVESKGCSRLIHVQLLVERGGDKFFSLKTGLKSSFI